MPCPFAILVASGIGLAFAKLQLHHPQHYERSTTVQYQHGQCRGSSTEFGLADSSVSRPRPIQGAVCPLQNLHDSAIQGSGGNTHPQPTGVSLPWRCTLHRALHRALYLRLPLAGYFRPLSSPAHLFLSPSFHLQPFSIPWHFRQLVFHLSSPSPVRLLLLNQQGCSLFTASLIDRLHSLPAAPTCLALQKHFHVNLDFLPTVIYSTNV